MKIYHLNEPSEKCLQRDQAVDPMDELMDELKKCFNKTVKKPTTSWHLERYISNPHGIPMKPKSSRFDDCDEAYACDYDFDLDEDYPEPF